jgi:transcriptional regulator
VDGLLDGFAKEGIGESAGLARRAAGIRSAEELLVIEEPGEFISTAYRVLLRRPADVKGVANYKRRMLEGISRTRVLHELFHSQERQDLGTGLPGLREAFARDGLVAPEDAAQQGGVHLGHPAQNLLELMREEGAAFIECAYLTLLKRPPDEGVLYQQSARLRQGESRLQLLSEIARLREASAAVHRLPGLSQALSRYRLASLPVVGRLAWMFGHTERNTRAQRERRVEQQRVAALEAELRQQVARLEKAAADAQELAVRSLHAVGELEMHVASLERSSGALRKLIARYIEDVPELDPSPQEDGIRLPSRRLEVDARAEEIFRDLRKSGA